MNNDRVIIMLSALAQATRLRVFRLLMKRGEAGLPAGRIAEALNVPQNTLSAHLSILSNAGLVSAQREGRSLIYSVNVTAVKIFIGYMVNDCCEGHPEICDISVSKAGSDARAAPCP